MTFSPEEASKYLTHVRKTKLGTFRTVTISPKQLANLRSLGKGPQYSKVGHKIVYSVQELAQYKKTLTS